MSDTHEHEPVNDDDNEEINKNKHQALLDALGDTTTTKPNHHQHDDQFQDEELDEEIPLDSPRQSSSAHHYPPHSPDTTSVAENIEPVALDLASNSHSNSGMGYEGSASSVSISKSGDNVSISSESQRKLRPESVLMPLTKDPLVLGIALVDFDHTVGPRIEFHTGPLLSATDPDEEIMKLLPFLALPDGAHLNQEDYSYFHLVPSITSLNAVPKLPLSPPPTNWGSSNEGAVFSGGGSSQILSNDPSTQSEHSQHPPPSARIITAKVPQTIFGISCNRQIAASELLVKGEEVTRSTVQKAVVILASKPVFGPIRDKLGVVTQAFFNQRDFRETDILVDFYQGLERSLRSQLTESGFYMGTSIRELIRAFRQRTLTLVKALMLQRKIVFYGHPVERLCTYQYSLVSLIPGLLQTLEDCGSPALAERARTLKKPNELKTSDRKSMMAFMGMPLDLFGKDGFFQPYLPLQQIDMLSSAQSCLCGATNTIVTQHKEIDMLVNIETSQIEYRTPHVERLVALTPADRKWIGDIVEDVNTTWNESDPQRPIGMQFKGSDDYLRTKFEEYISAALSSAKYHAYQTKGSHSVLNTGEPNTSYEDFGELFMQSFQATHAHDVWDRITDPILFDIIEPKHPCDARPNIVSDLGMRLSEGITDLHLDQQLAPAAQAVSNVFSIGSTSFFKAVEGVRDGVGKVTTQQKGWALPSFSPFSSPNANHTTSPNPSSSETGTPQPPQSHPPSSFSPSVLASTSGGGERKLRPLSLASVASVSSVQTNATNVTTASNGDGTATRAAAAVSGWGSSIGGWMGNKASRLRGSVSSMSSAAPSTNATSTAPHPESRMSVTSLNRVNPNKGTTTVGNSASSALFGLAAKSDDDDVQPTPTSSHFAMSMGEPSPMPTPPPNK